VAMEASVACNEDRCWKVLGESPYMISLFILKEALEVQEVVLFVQIQYTKFWFLFEPNFLKKNSLGRFKIVK
jgi:hypothetical protein